VRPARGALRGGCALAAATASLALAAAPAGAQSAPGSTGGGLGTVSTASDPDALTFPPTQDRRPQGRRRTAREVLATAAREPKVRQALREHPGATPTAYLKGSGRWQVSYLETRRPGQRPGQRTEVAQVLIDDRSGVVLEAWTGYQVPWTMARGYPGAFGRHAAAVYVWLPLLALFLVAFFDRRRPLSWRNLDLLVLCSLSVSLAFFSHGRIAASVPLAYPPLLYLLVRMLALARNRAGDGERRPAPQLGLPVRWLAIGLVFLVAFRVTLNVVDSNVIDVGYAGVIGADRLVAGEPLYGDFPRDNDHGDTYGPVVYLSYVPFELVWPWSGEWDDLPAAHGAAVFFDLLTIALLWLLGRRLRGPDLGVALAYGWAAFPFTLYASSSNTNDSLVAALVVAAILAIQRPSSRGALTALAGLTKFAPLVLAPLLALADVRSGPGAAGRLARFSLAFAVTAVVVMAPVLAEGDLRLFWERTLAYQGGRESPFSIWGLVGGLGAVQIAVQAGAVALALAVALVPRRRDTVSLCALAAAVLIAAQLGVEHWFYLYVVWFFPLVLAAVLGEGLPPAWRAGVRSDREPAPAPARSSPPASVASS
jgi:hypothetical protein